MKKLFCILLLPLFFAACKHKEAAQAIVRPVRVVEAGRSLQAEQRFPGSAEAQEYSYLDFRVSGMITTLNADQGQNVRKGDLLAALDPRDYTLRVSAAEASWRQSSLQLERYANLYARQAISRQEYEIVRARNENDRAVYLKAQNDLADTRLKAPFTGNIEEKYVENHQQISPGQKIFKLTNPRKLQFRFVLPETMASLLQNDSVRWNIAFDAAPERPLDAYVDKIVTSSEGAGIPVILRISDAVLAASKIEVLPGDACSVIMELPAGIQTEITLPLSSVYADPHSGKTSVWKVGRADSTLSLVPVRTGKPIGESGIEILDGIDPGDLILTAGVTMVAAGEKVKILPDGAEPENNSSP